jgi:hypothetical protein
MICWPSVGLSFSRFAVLTQREIGTVPKTYPRSDNAAFFVVLAILRINKLRGINSAQ